MALCRVAMVDAAPVQQQMRPSLGLQDQKLTAGGIASKVCGMCLGNDNDTCVLSCLKATLCPCWVVNDSYTKEDKCWAVHKWCIQFDGCAPQCCCALLEPNLAPPFMTAELHHLDAYEKGDCAAFTCAYCCSTCLMAKHNNARAKVVSAAPASVPDTSLLAPSTALQPFKW